MGEKKRTDLLRRHGHELALGGEVVAVLSILLLMPLARRRREQQHHARCRRRFAMRGQ